MAVSLTKGGTIIEPHEVLRDPAGDPGDRRFNSCLDHYAVVAQLVEYDLAKVGVAGSSPVYRSKNKNITLGHNCPSVNNGRSPMLQSKPEAGSTNHSNMEQDWISGKKEYVV